MAFKRAQAAVEYLIILAVVIIIALVVVGVLGGFPSLTRGVNEKESALYWQGAEIAIQRFFIVYDANKSTFTLRNNKNFDVRLNLNTYANTSSLQITDNTGAYTFMNMTCRTPSDCPASATTVVMSPGDSKTFYVNHPDWQTKFCLNRGDTFSRRVTFNYQDVEGNGYTFVGTIPLVTTCQ